MQLGNIEIDGQLLEQQGAFGYVITVRGIGHAAYFYNHHTYDNEQDANEVMEYHARIGADAMRGELLRHGFLTPPFQVEGD